MINARIFWAPTTSNRFDPLKESLHGRELTCVRYVCSTSPDAHVCVTGSEDTVVNVVLLRGSELTVLHRLTGHISSVRALAVVPCVKGNFRLVVSFAFARLRPVRKQKKKHPQNKSQGVLLAFGAFLATFCAL